MPRDAIGILDQLICWVERDDELLPKARREALGKLKRARLYLLMFPR